MKAFLKKHLVLALALGIHLVVVVGVSIDSGMQIADHVVPPVPPIEAAEPAGPSLCTASTVATGATSVADSIVASHSVARYAEARAIYEAALKSDPISRCAAVGLVVLADEERAAAAAEKEDAKKGRNWGSQVDDRLTAFRKAYVAPLAAPGAAILAVILLLLVLSRLVAGRVVATDQVSPGDRARNWAWCLGAGYGLNAAALAVLTLPSTVDEDAEAWLGALGVVMLGAFAIVLIGYARGTKLALQVEVVGEDGSSDTTKAKVVIGALTQLGSQSPRGLTTTGVSDLTKLPEDALTEVPTGALASAIFTLVRVVRPLPPWRLSVALAADSTATVSMTRNGVSVTDGTLVLRDAHFPVIEKKSDDDEAEASTPVLGDRFLVAAAAHALIVMKERHQKTLEPGLTGADHWRGLALHALGVRLGLEAEQKAALLKGAAAQCPKFALPQLVLAIDMETKSESQWQDLANTLTVLKDEYLDPAKPLTEGYEAWQVRLFYNLAVSWFNVAAYQTEAGSNPASAFASSRVASGSLADTIDAIGQGTDDDLKKYVKGIRGLVAYLAHDLMAHEDNQSVPIATLMSTVPSPETSGEFYAHACLFAGLTQPTPEDVNRALVSLEKAVEAPGVREVARLDPSFRHFRAKVGPVTQEKKRAYKVLTGVEPIKDFLELSAFDAHGDAIKKLGLTTAIELLSATSADLKAATGVHRSVAERWLDIARLYQRVPKLDDYEQLAILALLLEADVASPATFAARLTNKDALFDDLEKAAATSTLLLTKAATVGKW